MGQLRVTLTDVRGRPVRESTVATLRHRATMAVTRATLGPVPSTIIAPLAEGVYQVAFETPGYRPSQFFVDVRESGVTRLDAVSVVDPTRVRGLVIASDALARPDTLRLLNASAKVLGFVGRTGAELLAALDPLRQAGFLNILAKSAVTMFPSGVSVASYFQELLEIRGARVFAVVPPALRDDAMNSVPVGLLREVSDTLHRPPDGFAHAGSFKTADRYGNLQLTFFTRGDQWVCDLDIDEAAGIEHVFQAAWQESMHADSQPYDIQQILLQHQKLDPLYDLVL